MYSSAHELSVYQLFKTKFDLKFEVVFAFLLKITLLEDKSICKVDFIQEVNIYIGL